MKKILTGERIVNTCLFLLSVFYLTYSQTHYKLGTVRMPKEGFLPLILGIGMTGLSAWLMIQSYMGRGDAKEVKLSFSWLRFGALIAVSLIYALTLQSIGYLIGTFVFLLLIFKIAGVPGWVKPAVISLVCAIVFYLVFKKALGVMLPSGILPW